MRIGQNLWERWQEEDYMARGITMAVEEFDERIAAGEPVTPQGEECAPVDGLIDKLAEKYDVPVGSLRVALFGADEPKEPSWA